MMLHGLLDNPKEEMSIVVVLDEQVPVFQTFLAAQSVKFNVFDRYNWTCQISKEEFSTYVISRDEGSQIQNAS